MAYEKKRGVAPFFQARLKRADMDTLLVWSERVLTCATLDEVVGK